MCDSFHISDFHVCWAVDIRGSVFSAVLSNSCQKTTMADFHYKSIKSWKIDNVNLTQKSSLSIFTEIHYQSIKITWMLPIFIDTDFYRLSTPGNTYSSPLIKIMHQSIFPCSYVYQMMKVSSFDWVVICHFFSFQRTVICVGHEAEVSSTK